MSDPPLPDQIRPFLKWAGGKRQLLPELRGYYPDTIHRYFEPFLGSGAVFFDLWSSGRLRHSQVTLTDDNADLIGCYLRIRDSVEAVISRLEDLQRGHADAPEAHYYLVRDSVFNPLRATWRDKGGRADDYPVALAAALVYLNRTGYNGLFRVNSSGSFNVPVGRYERPRIVDARRLRAVAAVLSSPSVRLAVCPFEEACAEVSTGDLVYLDPPYAPLSRTASFRSYTASRFDADDHVRLQRVVLQMARRGARVILSNSTAPAICALYEKNRDVQQVGLRAERVAARRAINARATSRGAVSELLVTNLARAT